MRNFILIVSLIAITNSAFSQKNYQPGSVVTLNGETITGEINYKNWKKTPEKILFRKDGSSSTVQYGVNDISSFSVGGDVYKRAIVEITERQDQLNDIKIGDSFPSRVDTVFLLTVVSGPKSLYYYTDNVDHFYITREDGSFEWLIFKKFKVINEQQTVAGQTVASNNQTYVATHKLYIGQLKAYFKNCSVVSNNLKYKATDLRKAFLSYYDCIGRSPEFIQKADNEKIELGLLAGATNTSFKVNTSSGDLIGKVDYSKSNDVTAGVFAEIVFPRQRGRISLNNELMYSSYKTEGKYGYAPNPYFFDDYIYEFQYSYVKMNNMIRYKFFVNNLIIFINGGISNGIALKEVNRYTKIRTYNGEKTSSTGTAFEQTRKWELGLLAGAGVKFNRASLELRAERGMGPFNATRYAARVDRFSALFGFRLK